LITVTDRLLFVDSERSQTNGYDREVEQWCVEKWQ